VGGAGRKAGPIHLAADSPLHQRFSFLGAVTDEGQACGEPLSWKFSGEALLSRFVDTEGNLVRIQVQVRQCRSVTDLASGEIIELPGTAFTERVLFVEDGSIIIEDVGHAERGERGASPSAADLSQ
jgi:hypothetical protein